MRSFHLALDPAALAALRPVVADFKSAEKFWLAVEREAADKQRTSAERAAAHRKVRAQLAEHRAAGRYMGNRDLVLTAALRLVLAARGLNGPYPPVPDGAVQAGRPLGDSDAKHGHRQGEGGYKGRLLLKVPDDLGEQLVRAVYWTSWKAVSALRQWDAMWGQQEVVPAEALTERDRLRRRVVTTGDLLRETVSVAYAQLPRTIPGTNPTGTPLEARQEPPGRPAPSEG